MKQVEGNHQEEKQAPSKEEEVVVEVLQKPPPPAGATIKPPSSPAKIPPPRVVNKTEIPGRLRDAVKAAKPVNRSSDLVPLTHDFDAMRKNLTALVQAAKNYQKTYVSMNQARMDLITKFSLLATKSPIFDPIANTAGTSDSFAMVAQDASQEMKTRAAKYQDQVVDYCVEWERVVTTRVDQELMEAHKLGQRLNHYQTKVEGLRKRVNNMNSKGKTPNPNLVEKVARNEKKLDAAWRQHEKSASKLCNLLEEVTLRGWKDLFPLVKNSMNWEVERAAGDYDVFARLPVVTEDLGEIYYAHVDETPSSGASVVPIALADESDSDTTGSFHEEEDTLSGGGASSNGASHANLKTESQEEEYEVPPAGSPKRNKSKSSENSPKSPTHVAHV